MDHVEPDGQAPSERTEWVAHDLRGTVTPVVGFAWLLWERWDALDDDARRQLAHKVASGGTFLATSLENLLSVARLESGEMAIRSYPFDLAEAITPAIEPLAGMFPSVEVTAGQELPLAHGDPALSRLIVTNLVVNAIKYSPEGAPVGVDVHASDGDVRVAVRDAGPGIPRAEMEDLFQKWVRRGVGNGFGYGLYISRRLAEAQGGRVWLDADAQPGSRFLYSLPNAAARLRKLAQRTDRASS